MRDSINKAVSYIQEKYSTQPKIGLILGSGLGILADEIDNAVSIPYHSIPEFPQSTVEGHAGELVCGDLEGVPVIAMKGRFHYYEGYSMQTVTFPVRVMKELGVEIMIVTNAAGGVNPSFAAGDLMIISDHLNLTGDNPLIGKNDASFGPRFPDMTDAYSNELRTVAKQIASDLGIKVQEGVYAGFSGPTYETPAEVKMAGILGADAVGMSTVSEVVVARHSGLKVLGISCISNMAAGISPIPLSHDEVMETTERVKGDFKAFVRTIVKQFANKK